MENYGLIIEYISFKLFLYVDVFNFKIIWIILFCSFFSPVMILGLVSYTIFQSLPVFLCAPITIYFN